MNRVVPLALLILTLAGCTRDTRVYPSLSLRPVEQMGFAEPKAPVVVAKPDPALDAKIGDVRAKLATLSGGFADDA
ncbi:hypothetical protein LJD42_26690, partial [Escherichia coli]|nr:hypothetical protein [Escherichia coli]